MIKTFHQHANGSVRSRMWPYSDKRELNPLRGITAAITDNLQYYIHSFKYSNKNVWGQPRDKNDQKHTNKQENQLTETDLKVN